MAILENLENKMRNGVRRMLRSVYLRGIRRSGEYLRQGFALEMFHGKQARLKHATTCAFFLPGRVFP